MAFGFDYHHGSEGTPPVNTGLLLLIVTVAVALVV